LEWLPGQKKLFEEGCPAPPLNFAVRTPLFGKWQKQKVSSDKYDPYNFLLQPFMILV